ncbi:uncharacterized protein LOC132063064 [Lycium ferocissimum]|uniref:uncharacterized protein LOC132063064 n=1 Tax=Lycium ferocissimum TaxID=112874 RepID=UPI00281638E7|nr:uncharacterized protein LOC132063064 [Lycium ferocissimum]
METDPPEDIEMIPPESITPTEEDPSEASYDTDPSESSYQTPEEPEAPEVVPDLAPPVSPGIEYFVRAATSVSVTAYSSPLSWPSVNHELPEYSYPTDYDGEDEENADKKAVHLDPVIEEEEVHTDVPIVDDEVHVEEKHADIPDVAADTTKQMIKGALSPLTQMYKAKPPFPQRLAKKNDDAKCQKFYDQLKQLTDKGNETIKPWVESSFGKQLEITGDAQKKGESTSQKSSKKNNDEESSLSRSEHTKEKSEEQSYNSSTQREKHDQQQQSKEKQEEHDGKSNKQQQQTEEEQENNMSIHNNEHEVPDKPPDELTDLTVRGEDVEIKSIVGDTQSSSKGDKGAEWEIQSTGEHQTTNAMEGSGDNMKDKGGDKPKYKIGDTQKDHNKLTAKNFEPGGQTVVESCKEIDIGDDNEMDDQDTSQLMQQALIKGRVSPRHLTKTKKEANKKQTREKGVPPTLVKAYRQGKLLLNQKFPNE